MTSDPKTPGSCAPPRDPGQDPAPPQCPCGAGDGGAEELSPPSAPAPPAALPSSPVDGRAAPEPGGAARPAAAAPPAPNGEQAREAWRKAVSDLHAGQRRQRGRWTPRSGQAALRPGMNRRPPPEPPQDAA